MAFNKTGETKVFRSEGKLGPKFANSDDSNRYTVDDMVQDVDKMVSEGLGEKDATDILDSKLSGD